jgi:hypothetical protein
MEPTLTAWEPVTLDQAETIRAERDARDVVRLRALRKASPRLSLQRFLYWRDERAAARDVIDAARDLIRRAWERDIAENA